MTSEETQPFDTKQVEFFSLVLADDHGPTRQWIRGLLDRIHEFRVQADLADAAEVIALLERQTADCVIADVNMPGMSGIELTRKLHQHHPQLPVVIISSHTDEPYVIESFAAGALAYVYKGCAVTHLGPAIQAALAKRRFVSPPFRQYLVETPVQAVAPSETLNPLEMLTQKERSMVRLLVERRSMDEIAVQMGTTVLAALMQANHLQNKLKLVSWSEAAHLLPKI